MSNNKKLYLSILWHQHQPYYKSAVDGEYKMPWVFLHAIKDYYDMASHVYNCNNSNLRINFNFVPSLLRQLKDYEDLDVNDSFLNALRKPVESLSNKDKQVLLAQFTLVNQKTMLVNLPYFRTLLNKISSKQPISEKDIIDMSVLYLLSWTGYYYLDEPIIKDLMAKAKGFTNEDKLSLLSFYSKKIKEIIPIHTYLAQKGIIELSFTPFYHPILPLLADFDTAKEAMPTAIFPSSKPIFGDDFKVHVDIGYEYHKGAFGSYPSGVWPAEGSVSPETVDYYISKGLKWVATDEDILKRSINIDIKEFPNRKELYRKYYRKKNNMSLNIFFRDKHLSDLIGFTYSNYGAKEAVADFLSKLEHIYNSCDFSPHVSIVLDGENAWEYYPNNGSDFFKEFYEKISSSSWIQMQTFSEASVEHDRPLNHLASGSWIDGNFRIWCGNSEKNKGWEYLNIARNLLSNAKEKISPEVYRSAYDDILAAEGSDWFWWYGDDHFTSQSLIFDELFRTNLISACNKASLETPQEFYQPIKKSIKKGTIRYPSRLFDEIVINGKDKSYLKWLGSGLFDLTYEAGAMHGGGSLLRYMNFSYSSDYFYFGIHHEPEATLPDSFVFLVNINDHNYIFNLSRGKSLIVDGIKVCFEDIIEGSIPLELLTNNDNRLYFSIKNKLVEERAPLYTYFDLQHNFNQINEWVV